MIDTPTPEKTYKGTWKEVLSHQDEIPETSEVEVRVFSYQTDNGEEEHERMQKIMEDFLKVVFRIAAKENRSVNEVSEELIRQARFPMIEFRTLGRYRLACVRDGMEVWQMIMVARNYKEDTVTKTAEHVVLKPEQVQAALDYYAAYPDEIDELLATNDEGYDRLKLMFPRMGITVVTDEALARIKREYHFDDATP